MQIPLNQFEQLIDETILKRGLQYFKNGHVREPEEISSGEYEAIVEGTEDYTVQLTLKNGIITEHVCDCPFDIGPVCKHVAAVIFYIQQDELGLTVKTKKTKTDKKTKSSKPKTIDQKIDDLLEKTSHIELKEFVREKALENPQFRNMFFSSFLQHSVNDSKEIYVKQIKSILRAAKGRHGFIDRSASRFVGNAINNLMDVANKQFEKHNYKSVFFICTAVLEQMTDALQYADDSNGDYGGNIDLSYDLLLSIAKNKPSEEIRKLIIEYCFTAFDKQIFKGWDWHTGVLQIASLLIETEEEIERMFKQIDNVKISDFRIEEVQCIKYDVLLKFRGESDAEKYLEQFITNSELRSKAIEKEIDKKNYDKAIALAKDGINYDLKDKPGLAKEWYNWLLKIALSQNNTEKIIEYARFLFIDNFIHELDYYEILKKHVKPEDWVEFIENVIKDIYSNNKWFDTNLISTIFIKEEWWDKLLELVKETSELRTLDYYEKYLAKVYPNEMAELYIQAILLYLKRNVGRDHYQFACRYIRRVIKLGARDKANEIIAFLRNEYPQRKALMEELNKV